MADLLTGNVVLAYTSEKNSEYPKGEKYDKEKTAPTVEMAQAVLRSVHNNMKELLGVDAESILALETAFAQVKSKYQDYKTVYSGDYSWKNATKNAFNAAVQGANDYISFSFGDTRDELIESDQRDTVAVNLSNMIGAYLTYFELTLNGYNSPYSVASTRAGSNFVTDDPDYNYVMNNGKETSADLQKADFYMQLYNNICKSGWSENERVEKDNAYVEQMLKNGTFFLSTLSHDGYYYQERYNEDDCIVEVKDKDAIAQAEADFQAAKTKLTYKEEKLDLEMKNLDVEISSLTTEYDSVKQLISKNVEKVFSQFQ